MARRTDKNRSTEFKWAEYDRTDAPNWEPIDDWFERWEKAHDPGCVYGAYGKDPATVISTRSAA